MWIEDNDTTKNYQNIKCYQTLSEAESDLVQNYIWKNNPNDFFTIRKIYF